MGRIVTAGSKSYKDVISIMKRQAERLRYPLKIYDLGGLGEGISGEFEANERQEQESRKKTGFMPCRFKPAIIRRELKIGSPGELIFLLDADAIPRHRIDEVDTGDYDVGVTIRKKGENEGKPDFHISGYVNAGVLFLYNNKAAQSFVDLWIAKTNDPGIEGDQHAINEILIEHGISWDTKRMMVGDTRIRCFPTSIYNFYYSQGGDTARIIHRKNKETNWVVRHFKDNIGHWRPKFSSPMQAIHAVRDIVKDKKVCVLGVGTGSALIGFGKYAQEVTAVEINPVFLEHTRMLTDFEIIQGDFRTDPIPDADVYYIWIDAKDMEPIIPKLQNTILIGRRTTTNPERYKKWMDEADEVRAAEGIDFEIIVIRR